MSDIFNKDCSIKPVEILKQHWNRGKYSFMKNPRPFNGIMVLINGRINFVSKTNTLCANPGDVIFLPEGCHYEAVFHIENGITEDYLINFGTNEKFSFYKEPEKILENASFSCIDLFRRIIDESYSVEKNNFRIKGNLYLLLDEIEKEKQMQKNKHSMLINKAKELLQSGNDISICDISKRCAVSESGLRKLFKESIGISPAQYRLNFKINKAKYLLESTNITIEEISDMLHFYDAAYFCKIFKKYAGITPKKYVRSKQL